MSLVPFLKDLLKDDWLVRVQGVNALQNIIYYEQRKDNKVVFGSIAKQLCPLINDIWT